MYIDQVLPFGLCSVPMIFSALADALLWIMLRKGVSWAIHYTDDFLTMGSPSSLDTPTRRSNNAVSMRWGGLADETI